MIEIKNVSKNYGNIQALKDVGFYVRKNTVMGLLGQNGAGKTTLLDIITGYKSAGSGDVLINGLSMEQKPVEAKRLIGYVPEKPPLYDEMTVNEYMYFVARIKQIVNSEISEHINEILNITGLANMKNRLLKNLSKGYRQRVGLAQALVGNPEILVLDEPTVGLDPRQVTEVRALVQKLAHTHTIIFSSHILSEVQQLCNRVAILHQGKLCFIDDMTDAVKNDKNSIFELSVKAPEEKFVTALRSLDFIKSIEVLPPAHCSDGITTVLLSCGEEKEPQLKIFTLCTALATPIMELHRRQTTLEQVFLRITS